MLSSRARPWSNVPRWPTSFCNHPLSSTCTTCFPHETRYSRRWKPAPGASIFPLSAQPSAGCWRCWWRYLGRAESLRWAPLSGIRRSGSRAPQVLEPRVHYTDGDPAQARDAGDYFRRAGVSRRIHIQVGDAVRLLSQASGKFDLIFCDIDKSQYPAAIRRAMPMLRRGGLLLADNVLWTGKVSAPASDDSTRAIQKFNHLIYSSGELFPVIVPLRDGVAVCRKR